MINVLLYSFEFILKYCQVCAIMAKLSNDTHAEEVISCLKFGLNNSDAVVCKCFIMSAFLYNPSS